MEVQTTTVTELEARSVTELQEILNAAKEGTMICVSLEVPDDEWKGMVYTVINPLQIHRKPFP